MYVCMYVCMYVEECIVLLIHTSILDVLDIRNPIGLVGYLRTSRLCKNNSKASPRS